MDKIIEDAHKSSPGILRQTEGGLAGIIFGVFCILVFLAILNYCNVLRVYQVMPSLSFLPHQNDVSTQQKKLDTTTQQINICTAQHSGYPLLADILTNTTDQHVGMYQGIVKQMNAFTGRLDIASTTSGNNFLFKIVSQSTTIYDIHHEAIPIDGVNLRDKVIVTFPCEQKSNFFILTQIQLIK